MDIKRKIMGYSTAGILLFVLLIIVFIGFMAWRWNFSPSLSLHVVKNDIKKSLHKKPSNQYVSNIDGVIGALPDINRKNRQNTLPRSPNVSYLKSLKYLEGVKAKYKNGRVGSYDVPEYLHYDDYKRAEQRVGEQYIIRKSHLYTVEQFKDNHKALLANYFAVHGDCASSKKYNSRSHPVIKALLNGEKNQTEYLGREYFILWSVGTYMLCDGRESALKLIENYVAGIPTKKANGDLLLQRLITQDQFNVAQVKFLIRGYSKIGADLYLAGYKNEALKYIQYAIKLDKEKLPDSSKVTNLDILKNMIYAGMYNELREIYPANSRIWSVFLKYKFSVAFARRGNLDGVFQVGLAIGKQTGRYSIPHSAIIILSKKMRAEHGDQAVLRFLGQVKKRIESPPFAKKDNVLTLMALAREFAVIGEKEKANEIISELLSMNLDFKVYLRKLLYTFTVVDKNAKRALQFYNENIAGVDQNKTFLMFDHVMAAAQYSDDQKSIEQIKSIAHDNRHVSVGDVGSGMLDFYLAIGDLESAEEHALKKGGWSRILSVIRGEDSMFYDNATDRYLTIGYASKLF